MKERCSKSFTRGIDKIKRNRCINTETPDVLEDVSLDVIVKENSDVAEDNSSLDASDISGVSSSLGTSNMTTELKKKFFLATVESSLLYGCEAWSLT